MLEDGAWSFIGRLFSLESSGRLYLENAVLLEISRRYVANCRIVLTPSRVEAMNFTSDKQSGGSVTKRNAENAESLKCRGVGGASNRAGRKDVEFVSATCKYTVDIAGSMLHALSSFVDVASVAMCAQKGPRITPHLSWSS